MSLSPVVKAKILFSTCGVVEEKEHMVNCRDHKYKTVDTLQRVSMECHGLMNGNCSLKYDPYCKFFAYCYSVCTVLGLTIGSNFNVKT